MSTSATLSPTAQATLLLTCYFSKASSEKTKPLTNAEWGRFALWLKQKSITPADLLVQDTAALLQGWFDSRISAERIIALLNRGYSLALAMEKWQRAGLWVVTRSDPEYPKRLKQRLKTDSPPVLFGCGNKELLNAGGLAVIGSRNANETDLAFTAEIGEKAASESVAIVSGGARGVDETAMLGAIRFDGAVIGVMPDSLLKAATSRKWRKGLMDGNTVLISPYYPEAGFSAGHAMARNKYIYCLADSSLVIHSGKKGGTLNGAEENLKKAWVPLWVKYTDDKAAANADLVAKGGMWLDEGNKTHTILDLFKGKAVCETQTTREQADLFSEPVQSESLDEPTLKPKLEQAQHSVENKPDQEISANVQQIDSPQKSMINTVIKSLCPIDFYQLFTNELNRLAQKPVTMSELIERTQLNKSQLIDWLKRAEKEGVLTKLSHPVRYKVENK